MGTIVDAGGHDVSTDRYIGEQTKMMFAFTIDMLNGGPEQHELSGEEWRHLDTIRRQGTQAHDAMRQIATHPQVRYLVGHWVLRFAPIVGALARVDCQPIESIRANVEGFQQKVLQNIGVLRHLWQEKTGQIMSMQTACEQVRWNGPRVKFVQEFSEDPHSPGAHFLAADALLPHVCQHNGVIDLLFDSEHVAPETLRIPVQEKNVDALQKDLAKYT